MMSLQNSNRKLWIDGSLGRELERDAERDAAYKHSKVTGDNCVIKQYKYDPCRSIKMARQVSGQSERAIQRVGHKVYVAGATNGHG
jgi:hypothetical protein